MDEMEKFSSLDLEPTKLDDYHFTPLDTPIPEKLPEPWGWRMFVMPVQIKKISKGGIIFASQSVDAQMWLHAIGRVVALGPLCFRHQRYTAMGMTDEMKPKVGQDANPVLLQGRQHHRSERRPIPGPQPGPGHARRLQILCLRGHPC